MPLMAVYGISIRISERYLIVYFNNTDSFYLVESEDVNCVGCLLVVDI